MPALTLDGGAEVVDRLKAQFSSLDVRSGAEVAEKLSKQTRDARSFVSYFLLAFDTVGLLAGTFLIANTFSMIVAQRTREFALLRALGASLGAEYPVGGAGISPRRGRRLGARRGRGGWCH